MKFYNYTSFDALFPSVVIDFPFLRLNQYVKVANCLLLKDAEDTISESLAIWNIFR